MFQNDRSTRNFKSVMRGSSRISDSLYKATTAKRLGIIIPEGISIFDTDLNKTFVGDGVTYGGITGETKASIRKIPVNAASATGLSANETTDKIEWDTYGGKLRTGDSITLAAGTGTLPSGLSATTYYIIKDAAQDADDFKIATTRANAILGTAIDILSSGVAGYTSVISLVCPQGYEEMLLIDPVGAAVDIGLPDANSNDGFKITVKRAAAGNFAVTVKELNASGNVSASGDVTIDDAAGYDSYGSGSSATGGTYIADGDSGEWFTI